LWTTISVVAEHERHHTKDIQNFPNILWLVVKTGLSKAAVALQEILYGSTETLVGGAKEAHEPWVQAYSGIDLHVAVGSNKTASTFVVQMVLADVCCADIDRDVEAICPG